MATSKASDTQTTVVTSTHTLATITDAGTYVLYLDLFEMADGDIIEIRVELKVTATGTTREFLIGSYAHAQGQPTAASIPVASINECVFSIKHVAGTALDINWEIVEL